MYSTYLSLSGMRRWFSKFGSTSVTSTSPITSPVPASSGSASAELRTTDSPLPSPSTPFVNSELDIRWNVDFASDPCSWESTFDTHWRKAEELLQAEEIKYEKVMAVFRHLNCTVQLLMMEANAQPESAIGPILDRYFTHQIMERVIDWAIMAPYFLTPTCQVNLIRLYEIIVGESHTQNHCLLVHKPILTPLLKLLEWCRQSAEKRNFTPSDMDRHFVLLLNQVCTKLAEDATLLHFFFDFCSDCNEQFLVFNLLIPYLYDSGDIGQLARDALLLILSVSQRMKHIASFIASKSNFCPVVATGLSGCFSQLSRSVGSMLYVSDDWHKINSDDIELYPSLLDFHSSLNFCNAVVQVAHSCVVAQVIAYVYHGFLLPVVLPSLLEGGQDELISSTAYYHLCLESVTEPALVQTVIKLLLVESDNNKRVVDVIVERISYGNRLSQVSLSLLRTLIDLRCEDIMFDLVFKYLLPCTFLQTNQAIHLKNQKYVREAAQMLLTLIPECTLKSSALCSQMTLYTYINECRNYVQQTANACWEKWVWNYDGRNPSFLMLKLSSDDESSPSCNDGFIRHSSVRLSSLSARSNRNRYFVSRNAHVTADSLRQNTPLPELGENDLFPKRSFPYMSNPSLLLNDDDDELIIPPLTPKSLMMMTSSSDYFQFAYGELSETDTEVVNPDTANSKKDSTKTVSDKENSSSANCDTDIELTQSFVLRGWGQVEDVNTFMALLDRVPPTKVKHSLEENLALIDSRIQYLEELKAENKLLKEVNTNSEAEDERNNNKNEECLAPLGYPIECLENQGVGPFLESLLRSLENILNNSLYVTLQTTSVLAALASYPQPLIAHYLFDQRMILQPSVKNLFKVISSLKMQIDEYASSLDGFDVLLERGIKFLRSRAERHEKIIESNRLHSSHIKYSNDFFYSHNDTLEGMDSSRNLLNRFRPFGRSIRRYSNNGSAHPHEFRIYTHKAMESRDVTLDHARAKQFVFAAIILSQFCQELAATVLQHSIVVPRPRGNWNKSN
ncbi:unnamed protein product [Thelazia callipaeda]|uniref:DUF5917 domain-containing protein n=1 Tax=Thelazia callipaeda TaxID=103827 RepID=A0A0N5D1N6_THECL|nr:unnamed protein product [Thelazia callipaeda]